MCVCVCARCCCYTWLAFNRRHERETTTCFVTRVAVRRTGTRWRPSRTPRALLKKALVFSRRWWRDGAAHCDGTPVQSAPLPFSPCLTVPDERSSFKCPVRRSRVPISSAKAETKKHTNKTLFLFLKYKFYFYH